MIVTSLAGGTGSGMLIDLTFLVRRLLRGSRLSAEHVVGLLALPPDGATGPALANARRTLDDLAYHDRPDTVYEGRLDRNAEPQLGHDSSTNALIGHYRRFRGS